METKTVTRITLLLALLALAAQANAQQLFKCVGKDGNVTYQSEPCPQAAKEDRLRAPAPGPTAAEPAKQAAPSSNGKDSGDPFADAGKKCLDDLMVSARNQWTDATKEGKVAAEFPESAFRESGGAMCDCLAQRARATTSPEEMRAKSNAVISKYMGEAIAGGECKPTGVVGQRLQGVK